MLFTKSIALFVGFMSIGVAFANPVPEAAPAVVEVRELKSRELEARQLGDILGVVQGLESSLVPILTSLTSAATAGNDVTGIIGDLVSTITGVTSTLTGLGSGAGPISLASATAIVTVVINIIVSLVGVLGKLSLSADILAQIDAVLSPFLTVLNGLVPGLSGAVGSGIPGLDLISLALSQLLSVINLLGLLSLLSPILAILGLLLKFYGSITAYLDVIEATSSLVFHSSQLELHGLVVQSPALSEDVDYPESAIQTIKENERAILSLSSELPAGSKAQLKIGFEGELTTAMMGYYRSSTERDGKTQYYALTQFEPTAARRAFPCWDEPALKASFTMTMISDADTINLSSMPSTSEAPFTPNSSVSNLWLQEKLVTATAGAKWKITEFQKSPRMSTYVFAFANGAFDYIEDSYKSPLSGQVRPLRVYATSELIGQVQFTLDVKKKVLPLYEQIFDIEYPLPKLDTLVAHDFDAGAMENWGFDHRTGGAILPNPAEIERSSDEDHRTSDKS
ncbi:Aminopeptidase 2 mitochondrial [Steccherinum ochraceum]|uniref:Aminopeptidase 2 mitochondrial n=1 Tax=Steccherinum ochraceum TaxID=92696 RepID=A0A4R0RKC6_9APHY|nr:Aminopeptidase 2 mitochondrial [Steccherinum ochraceum]